jgi:hypothetical protein
MNTPKRQLALLSILAPLVTRERIFIKISRIEETRRQQLNPETLVLSHN